MISNFQKTVSRFAIPLVVEDIAQAATPIYVRGEYQESYMPSGIAYLMPIAFSANELRYQTDGTYTAEDYKFVEVGSGSHRERSLIYYNGNKYKVKAVKDRQFEGNLTEYLCKRVHG